MLRIVVAGGLLALAGACAPATPRGPAVPLSAEQVDRGCVLAAGDELRARNGVEAGAGRALPWSEAAPGGGPYTPAAERTVELDAVSVGLPVTYVFYCAIYGGRPYVSFAGRR